MIILNYMCYRFFIVAKFAVTFWSLKTLTMNISKFTEYIRLKGSAQSEIKLKGHVHSIFKH